MRIWSDLRGKPLDPRGLAHRLGQYGIERRTIRLGDTTAKGYDATDLYDAWQRYLPDPRKSGTSVTAVTPQVTEPESVTDESSVTDAAVTPPLWVTESEPATRTVTAVTPVTDLRGSERPDGGDWDNLMAQERGEVIA